MKLDANMRFPLRPFRSVFSLALALVLAIPGGRLLAQDSAAAAAPDSTAAKAETISPLVEFTSTQKNNNTIDLKATFKAKVNGNLTKLSGLKVEFFSGGDAAQTKVGEAVTTANGIALVNVPAQGLSPDAEGKLNFKVNYAGSATIDAAEESVSVKRARLEVTPVKEDSVISLQVKLVDLSTGVETPVAETDLGIYVKRLFLPLKIGEGKTDEAGEALVVVPNNLPGDPSGNLTLMARVDDNADYGNLEAVTIQRWGKPVSNAVQEMPRALWSTHPPLWMLITFIVLMTAVWGHYFVIVYELFRLKKEHA